MPVKFFLSREQTAPVYSLYPNTHIERSPIENRNAPKGPPPTDKLTMHPIDMETPPRMPPI
jgi:hypothetical protein